MVRGDCVVAEEGIVGALARPTASAWLRQVERLRHAA